MAARRELAPGYPGRGLGVCRGTECRSLTGEDEIGGVGPARRAAVRRGVAVERGILSSSLRLLGPSQGSSKLYCL